MGIEDEYEDEYEDAHAHAHVHAHVDLEPPALTTVSVV
jgi:hypothetical protein